MKTILFCLWILIVHTDAQQHPDREEGAVQPGWSRQSRGRPARGPGDKVPGGRSGARRRAALSGPHVCGDQCCVGWTLSPKTRKCTKPRCFPRCRNRALCRQSNRCVCRRGFHGSRCEFSAVTFSRLTSIHPTIIPLQLPVHNTPQPTVKPAGSRVMGARSGPADILTQPAKSGATDTNPSSPPAENHKSKEAAEIPKSGSGHFGVKGEDAQARTQEKGGVHKLFSVQGENHVSLSEEGKRKTEETLTNVQQRAVITEKMPTSDLKTVVEETLHSHSEKTPAFFKNQNVKSNPEGRAHLEPQANISKTSNLKSVSWTERKVTTEDASVIQQISNLESMLRPEGEPGQHVESNSGSEVEEGLNVRTEFDSVSTDENKVSQGSSKTDLQISPDHSGLRGERRLDVGESRRMEEEKPESEDKRKEAKAEGKKLSLSLMEAQTLLLRKTLSRGGRGDKLAALLMKHIEEERKKLDTSAKTSVKTFYTQKGQYTVHLTAPTADGQMGTGGGGGGLERIQVMFTPTICKVRCSQDRCVNYCERGNVTTLYSSNSEGGGGGGRRDGSHGPGFRVFLCPLLCKNGGVCLQKDRCLCPPQFTGKFCQSPVVPTATSAGAAAAAPESAAASPSSTNEIVKPALLPAVAANQELTQSEFLLPLGQNQEAVRSGGPSMVKVRVQHPPEASVKIHQVLKVSGFSPTLRTSSSSSGSAGAPAPAAGGILAQTVRGGGTYTQQSGFKYCFREVKDGQCSSPLPGLRSREMCCRGIGKGWGITDCVLCPDNAGQSNSSCPAGYERANGTQCVDVNECLQPGLCENGLCVNTRGSYSCVCRVGFILDATHGICISHSVISEEKGQCYRVLGSGRGPSSCSLPILRNITKQICCCSRVGKAWGPDCQRCPYFGSVAFKEICPAGPGYHYSASSLQFSQKVTEQLGSRGSLPVTQDNQDNQAAVSGSSGSGVSRSQQKPSSGAAAGGASGSPTSGVSSGAGSAGTGSTQTRPSLPQSRPASGSPASRPVHPGSAGTTNTRDKPQTPGRPGSQQSRPESAPSLTTQPRPQPPSTSSQAGGRPFSVSQPDQTPARGDSLPAPAKPQSPDRGSRPSAELPSQIRPTVSPTAQTARVQTVRSVCESRPSVCGRGRCVDQPGGKHTCVCDRGYQPNSQRTYCQDVNECVQSPGVCSVGECVNVMGSYRCACPPGYRSSVQQTSCQDIDECQLNVCINGRCENTPGSYRCVCRLGYRLAGNTCTDVDECQDPLQCPGQECINSQGSYRCVSCQPGYGLLNRLCTDIDECRQAPCSNGHCENTPGSYRCVCGNGYKLQNNTCADVDECAEPSQCPGQMCVNSVGSYRCLSCRVGYTLTNRKCTDINECKDKTSCPGQQCVNTEGSYHCVNCQQGFHSVNGVCTDVDECVQVSQCPGQQCVNTVGSYRCVSCQPGYSSEGGSCQDIDECASTGACEAEQVCVNTFGSFRCDCLPGYRTTGLGRQCRDINECLEEDFCFSGGECVNTAGSYTCVCSQGFTLSDNRTACLDVDECVKSGVCLDGRCVNTEGSFQCQCQTGFTTNPEKTACLDVDECVMSRGSVCGSRRCENTIGSFRCLTSCEPGYQVTHTGDCVDVNECTNTTLCGDHAVCHNIMGTYQCVCDQGFTSTPDRKACVAEMPTGSSSSSSSSSFHVSVVELDPVPPPLPAARPGELRECYYNRAEWGSRSLLAANTTQQECCCTVGEGWGLGFQYQACPPAETAGFLSLCPSGRGYVTTGPGAFSYRDVDECKRFHPEVCKNGVCVNNIPGYSCYCSSGYVYDSVLLECVDHNECEEESCVGGVCVNTVGSYYCSCPPPLVLDSTQRNCVNSSDLNVDENLSVCWQHLSTDMMCQSPLLGAQVTYVDCCCLYGVGWGMECAICPPVDFEDYQYLCSSVRVPLFPETLPESSGPEAGAGGRGASAPARFPPYSPDSLPSAVAPDYDDYSPAGGGRSSFRGRTPATYSLPERTYSRPEYSTGYYSEGDYRPPDGSPPRPPSFRLPPDPRAERAFGVRPPPPLQPDGHPLSLAPLPGAPYEEEEEEEEEEQSWRPGPPFPPFSERGGAGGGGGTPRRVYERRYESYTGLSAAEDCGILHGCENGRCIRVAEGYTCDCYQGYELDMTSMTCIDKNECEDSIGVDFPCVNARCVNTDGSFRCVCRRGYVMSRRPNHCVAA